MVSQKRPDIFVELALPRSSACLSDRLDQDCTIEGSARASTVRDSCKLKVTEADMPEFINIRYAKTHLTRLLDEVAKGQAFVITRAGKPLARLVPLAHLKSAPRRKKYGLLEGRFKVPNDFDAPLDAKVIALFR